MTKRLRNGDRAPVVEPVVRDDLSAPTMVRPEVEEVVIDHPVQRAQRHIKEEVDTPAVIPATTTVDCLNSKSYFGYYGCGLSSECRSRIRS